MPLRGVFTIIGGMKHGTLTADNHAALWHGRFKEGPDAAAVEFETSIYVDERMAQDDIKGSVAHAKMLGETGIISKAECARIVKGLESIAADLRSGKLPVDYSAEDIHSFIEATLTDRIGDAGKKLHTGRSRNDQIALDERLYLKRVIPELQLKIANLIGVLSSVAEQHTKTLMPGFTHMQHAQPVTLAHHLCAWGWSLTRDYNRLTDALKRIDFSPLGSGALAGSSLPLDREFVARELGFKGVTENSLDSVSDRDYCIEFASCFSMLQMHLSRFSEEIVLWATTEFGFVDLSEKWSTGSSIMPQKKNPDFAELIRGKTGRVYGDTVALFTMMKGLPLSYDRDMQEDKSSFFDAYDTVVSSLKIFSEMVRTAKWNVKIMANACEGGFLNATDIADYLVKKGMPFRTAHGVSACLVRTAIQKNCKLEELDFSDYKNASELFEKDIFDLILPEKCVEIRKITGAPASEKVQEQIDFLSDFVNKNEKFQKENAENSEWDLIFENLYK